MDTVALKIVEKIWKHSGIDGFVWNPSISGIGTKRPRFSEGVALAATNPGALNLDTEKDWYFTPAVSSTKSRKAGDYPSQRAVWVDCDDGYNHDLLVKLRPSYMWETSPGHMQAVWLLKDYLKPEEFHRDGFIGMITEALGADKSGVDIGQLLRFPGTVHHKGKPFTGKVVSRTGAVYTRGQLLTRVARGLGFPAGLASELGSTDPYGDRSKKLWQFSRQASELNLSKDLAYKLVKACEWNKWRDEPEKLREDIDKAYQAEPKVKDTPKKAVTAEESYEEDVLATPWEMESLEDFGQVIREPFKWLVPGIIPEGGCGLLVSAPKVGKTRIAIELAIGLATGSAPLGRTICKPMPVGFFSLEDGQFLFAQRISSSLNKDSGRERFHWDGHIKRTVNGLRWYPPRPMKLATSFAQIDLSESFDKERLLKTVQQYNLKLVIIDTLSMAIGKADVSSSTDMYSILKDIKNVARETGCAMMFIHHTRKRQFDKGESIQERVLGSTALHAWSDFVMSLAEPAEDSDWLRLGVQTKVGNSQLLVGQDLKIIEKPKEPETQG